MRPGRELVATAIVEAGTREVGLRARIVRVGDRIIAVGGGQLLEIDVARPAHEWASRPTPVAHVSGNTVDGPPLMIGTHGEVFAIQADLSLKMLWKRGISDALAIANGRMLLHPARRIVFGNWLVDAEGTVRWRIRTDSYFDVALEDVLLSVEDGERLVCRSTETGEIRWTRVGGSPKAIVDDTVWLVDRTRVIVCGLERGEERAQIDVGYLGMGLYVDDRGRGHAFAHGRYWTIDLRAMRVLTKYEITDPPRDMFAVLPLEDGNLVRSTEHALYRLAPNNGRGPLPPALWRSPALILSAVPYRNGLVVLTDADRPSRTVHWLAPAEHMRWP